MSYFSRRPEKMVFPKKSGWNMIFLVLSGKMIFLVPKNITLPLGRKIKDYISQKKIWKYDLFEIFWNIWNIFFGCFEKLHSNMIFLVLSTKMVFFPPKTWCFFFGWKMADDLSQEIHGNMIFSVYLYRRYKRDITSLCQRKFKDDLLPQKYT